MIGEGMGMGGGGAVGLLTWIIIIFDLVLVGVWLVKQISKK